MTVLEIKKKINKDAIEVLEEALNTVKSGEMVSVAVVGVLKNGGIYWDIGSGNNAFTMWAALMHTANEYYKENIVDV